MKSIVIAFAFVACSGAPKDPVAELEDPMTCMGCHPTHYTQWSGSMHAYASDDPIFVAMQNRGQREAPFGTFCVKCHAPMAVALHPDADYTNFDPAQLPVTEKGITCYYCHNISDVKADHNNGLELALDQTMHGGVQDPPASDSPAHNSVEDPLMRGASPNNKGTMCGSCHDVVTPAPHDVAIERTDAEWLTTIFAPGQPVEETCATCHMISGPTLIASGPGLNVSGRDHGFHDHTFAGIDQAISTFPETDAQVVALNTILKAAVQVVGPRPTGDPGAAAPGGLCLEPLNGGQIRVRVDNISVGHMYPSGAAQDRRAWVEVIAYDASNAVVFSSGVVADNQDPDDISDPNEVQFWDTIFKDDGSPAHFFWEVATEQSHLLKPAVTTVSSSPFYDHSTTQLYPVGALFSQIDHMTARIRIRPFNYAALDDLVASGDLDPKYAANIVTLDIPSASAMWTKATQNPTTFCDK